MRIVVTGASGNVGSALLRSLETDGPHDVLGLVRRVPGETLGGPAVKWTSVDLSKDSSAGRLPELFAGADAVVHLAWGFQPSHDQAYLEELGVGGTRRVIDAVAASGVPHLVHMSSVGAYSAKVDDGAVDESWPTAGIPTSWYSRSKAAAERLLDGFEATETGTVVTRMRPGIIGQRRAGSALLRYGLPAIIPSRALGWVPVLPMDARLSIPMVHSDDVARAIVQVIARRAGGAFNLAADPPLTTARIAEAFGARAVHVPSRVLRPAMVAAWHARLQQVDAGWLDVAFAVPLLDSSRARRELDWTPSLDGPTVFREMLEGMREAASDSSPVLRPRSVVGQLSDAFRHGLVSTRQRP